MKSILTIAGTLMAAAVVYGVSDYNKKADTREFKELYVAPKTAEVSKSLADPVVKEEAASTTEETTAPKERRIGKKKKQQRDVNLKMFSREAPVKYLPPLPPTVVKDSL